MFKLNPNHLKQAARAGITMAFAVCLGHLLKLNYAYWMLISVIVVLQSSVGATLLRAKQRSFSTLLGVLIGALLIVLLHGNLTLVIIATLLLTFLCFWLIFLNYFWAILFISAALILGLGFHSPDSWQFVLNRLFDTVLGVIIGIGFSLLLWPNWAKKQLNNSLETSLKNTQRLALLVIADLEGKESSLKEINDLKLSLKSSVAGSWQHYQEAKSEAWFKNKKQIRIHAILSCLDRIKDVLFAMHGMRHSQAGHRVEVKNDPALAAFSEQLCTNFKNFQAILTKTNTQPKCKLTRQTLANPSHCLATLYLQRNLDRIYFELNHLQQAFNSLSSL